MLSTGQEKDSIDLINNSKENLTKTLLAINRAYQEVIQEKLEKLRTALALNLQKQVCLICLKRFNSISIQKKIISN